MKNLRRLLAAGLLTAMLFTLPGCGGSPAASSPGSIGTAGSAVTPEPEPQPVEPAFYHPLTGVGMNEDLSRLRPVAVMLNDLKAAQPQLGVSRADII